VIRRIAALAGTGLGAATASALCCAGPLLAAVMGISGGALAGTLEPYRPLFLGVTGVALGSGYLLVQREERRACEPGLACASPHARRRVKLGLALATLLALILASYPTWSAWLQGGW
jgi:hypothetical protein